jgi:seryl-tRNA synthetase
MLAQRVRLDAFTKVKAAIDELVKALMDEQAAEVKKRDWCVDEFGQNEKKTLQAENTKKDILAKIAALDTQIKVLTQDIETLKAQIAEMEKQLKAASEAREAENKEFQATIADQQLTQRLLKQALAVLADFYGKGTTDVDTSDAETVLMQQKRQEPAGPPPPPGFEEYKKSAAGGGVMEMIEQIILDAKHMEDMASQDEGEAVKAYQAFVKETDESVAAKGAEVVAKSEEKAKAEGDLVEAKQEREEVLLKLEELANYNVELHQTCDFVMKNFDLRQQARSEEIEALRQAKAILDGSMQGA